MTKFLAVVKREYVVRVRSRMFIATTILGPLIMSLFGLVPALIFRMEVGGPLRIAVVDQTGRLYDRLSESLMNERKESEGVSIADGARKSVQMNSAERLQQVASQQRQTFWLQKIEMSASLEQTREHLFQIQLLVSESSLDGDQPEHSPLCLLQKMHASPDWILLLQWKMLLPILIPVL